MDENFILEGKQNRERKKPWPTASFLFPQVRNVDQNHEFRLARVIQIKIYIVPKMLIIFSESDAYA